MLTAATQELADRLLRRTYFDIGPNKIDCAVSGGADSVALMILAARCLGASGQVVAHHVDHGLRDGSDEEAKLVADAARRFGVAFVSYKVRVVEGPNLEARARHARFDVLPIGVATGHTLDDRAETIVINLLRGAAMRGLGQLSPSGRHPIVALRRSETQELCAVAGVELVEDKSNDDRRFLRNSIRHDLMPFLCELSQRDLAPILARQADLMRDEDRFLDGLARELDARDAPALAAADPVLARRSLRLFIQDGWPSSHPPDSAAVERMLAVARGEAIACEVADGYRVERHQQRLRLVQYRR